MKTFPMFLQMAGRRVIILGGGEQAAQKTRLMLKTEAEIVVSAEVLDPELEGLLAEGRITHHRGAIDVTFLRSAILVFSATGCAGAGGAHAALCNAAGVLVNVVDAPAICDAITPSIVDRDPVVVAIGTEGTAPVLARQIKTRVEQMLEPGLGGLAALAGRLRGAVAQRISADQRRAFWRWVFADEPRKLFVQGQEREAAKAIKLVIEAQSVPGETGAGFVSLIGAGIGSADLITLRGINRLQEADIILYDRLVDPGVLELARRDAERVNVGKTPGDGAKPSAWSQERINRLIVQHAQAGKRVVRLKAGDPGIFARGAEEARACDGAGIGWEIVPGISAASAASAQMQSFLTERGVTDTLVFTTAMSRSGEPRHELAALLRPGVKLAIYMGVSAAPAIQRALDELQLNSLQVEIIENAGHKESRVLRCESGDLSTIFAENRVKNPAMILVSWPLAQAKAQPAHKNRA